jgi:crossover junction endodeoxyribonuclease RusA
MLTVPAPRGARTRRHPEGEPLWLNANQRLHWAKRRELTKQWREFGRVFARSNRLPATTELVQVTAWCRWPRRVRRDPGNWYPTAKAVLDGLTDAGVWPDDDSTHVVGPDMREWPHRGPDALIIEITPARTD